MAEIGGRLIYGHTGKKKKIENLFHLPRTYKMCCC